MLARFTVSTTAQTQIIEITSEINKIVAQSNIMSGICTVFCPHTTAGIITASNADSETVMKMVSDLDSLFPLTNLQRMGESHAHIKNILTGNSLNFIISNGTLILGAWQGIFLFEHNGGKNRSVFVKLIDD